MLDDRVTWRLEPRTSIAFGKLRQHGSCRCRANRVAGNGTSQYAVSWPHWGIGLGFKTDILEHQLHLT